MPAPEIIFQLVAKFEENLAAYHPGEYTDAQIDTLVYELYGLTEEEIRIVEEG